MTLGQRIQELRRAAGLSQEALGGQLGVSRQAISKWEADAAVPEVDKLLTLSRLFGVGMDVLLQGEQTPGAAQTDEQPDKAPPETPEEEKKLRRHTIKKVSHAAAGVLAAAMLFVLVFGTVRLRGLEKQVDALARTTVQPGLDAAAPLVSDFSFRVQSHAISVGVSLDLDMSLIPAQSTDAMTVTFQISQPGQESIIKPARRADAGTEYSCQTICTVREWVDNFTISAVFDDGQRQYTQALARISGLGDNSYTWDSLWDRARS